MSRRKKEVTTGASNDLEKATRIVLAMVYNYGLTDVRSGCGFDA